MLKKEKKQQYKSYTETHFGLKAEERNGVFKPLLKTQRDRAWLTSSGNLFPSLGAKPKKTQSPLDL